MVRSVKKRGYCRKLTLRSQLLHDSVLIAIYTQNSKFCLIISKVKYEKLDYRIPLILILVDID
jgi:hypothetical protein